MMFILKLLDLGHVHSAPIPLVLTNILCLWHIYVLHAWVQCSTPSTLFETISDSQIPQNNRMRKFTIGCNFFFKKKVIPNLCSSFFLHLGTGSSGSIHKIISSDLDLIILYICKRKKVYKSIHQLVIKWVILQIPFQSILTNTINVNSIKYVLPLWKISPN